MVFAIDTGNTHTVLGYMDGDNVVSSFRIPTDRKETDCGYAARIKDVLELSDMKPEDFEGIIISSVVPSVSRELRRAVKMVFKRNAYELGVGMDTGLDLTAIPGGVIAPDLEAAAVGAKNRYPLPCVVIDMGTATTITVLDEKGRYIGGAIQPGAMTALNALVSGTSLLPGIEIEAPDKAIAVETISSMQSGLVYGSAGSIDGIIDHFFEEMEVKPESIVATGGLGRLICKHCRHEIIFDDDLVLKGMVDVYRRNCK